MSYMNDFTSRIQPQPLPKPSLKRVYQHFLHTSEAYRNHNADRFYQPLNSVQYSEGFRPAGN